MNHPKQQNTPQAASNFTSLDALIQDHLQNTPMTFKFNAPSPNISVNHNANTLGTTLTSLADLHLSEPSISSFNTPLAKTSEDRKRVQRMLIKCSNEDNLDVEMSMNTDLLSNCRIDDTQPKNSIERNEMDIIESEKGDTTNDSDSDIDLTDAIIKPGDICMNVLPVEPEPEDDFDIGSISLTETKDMCSKPVVYNKPSLPCLFSDPEYFREIQTKGLRAIEEKYKKMSPMAKVMCFVAERPKPQLKFQYYDTNGPVKMFDFSTPSPDEIVLEHLKKYGPPKRKFLEP